MWFAEIEDRWRQMAEGMFTEVKDWRLQHPKATFKEIETALDERMAKVRAQMLQDAAQASPLTDVSAAGPQERPLCPKCGQKLEARGQEMRDLTTNHNEVITLKRSYAVCPACGAGLFPPG